MSFFTMIGLAGMILSLFGFVNGEVPFTKIKDRMFAGFIGLLSLLVLIFSLAGQDSRIPVDVSSTPEATTTAQVQEFAQPDVQDPSTEPVIEAPTPKAEPIKGQPQTPTPKKPAKSEPARTLTQAWLFAARAGTTPPDVVVAEGKTRIWRNPTGIGEQLQIDQMGEAYRFSITNPSKKIWDYLGDSYKSLGDFKEVSVFYARDGVLKGWVATMVVFRDSTDTGLEILPPKLWRQLNGLEFEKWVRDRI
jgi:hypothetical protein